LTTIARVLENAGYETEQAGSGEQALQLEPGFSPDLAILDVKMAGMSGIELARHLQASGDTPFMFVSALGAADIVRQANEHGAVGYLLKPFELAQIVPAVETALGRADDIRRLRGRETSLASALEAGRETSMAVGLLMARYHVGREQAYDALRSHARSHRSKVLDVAASLLEAEDLFNAFHRALHAPAAG
jgi:response regulator NasT